MGPGAGTLKKIFCPSTAALPHQLADDPAHDQQAVRLLGVEHAVLHGPPGFHVEHLGELLRVVAGHHDFRALHLVEDVLPLQKAFGQLGVGQRQESVELRLVFVFLLSVSRHHDPARADVEAERLGIVCVRLSSLKSLLQLNYSYGRASSRRIRSAKRRTLRSSSRIERPVPALDGPQKQSQQENQDAGAASHAPSPAYLRATRGALQHRRQSRGRCALPWGTQNAAASVMRCDSCCFCFCQARKPVLLRRDFVQVGLDAGHVLGRQPVEFRLDSAVLFQLAGFELLSAFLRASS